MMFRLPWLLTVLTASAIAVPEGAHAQKPEATHESDPGDEPTTGPPGVEEGPVPAMGAEGIQAELLDAVFEQAAIGTRKARKLAGLAGVLGGATLLGLGAWRLSESSDSRSNNEYSRGLGIMFTTLGMVDLTTGIIALKRASHEERRYARWKKHHRNKKQLTQLELARYEGEFEASTRIRNSQRTLVRWNGLTHALAGVIVMSLAPIPDLSRRGRNSALIVGSVFVGAGAATFGLSFRPTANEKAWKQYKKGKAGGRSGGYEPSGGWFIQPMLSHRELGLGLRGTF